jgi:hypothetical protein
MPGRPALQLETEYRSRLEKKIADQLQAEGIAFGYETLKVPYVVPERNAKYNPDFLPADTDIILEGKGWFKPKDRQKLVFVKEAHPHLDIRLVFQNAQNKLYKGSPTTYAKWADDHGFPWCDKGTLPAAWIKEMKQRATRKRRTTPKK